METTTTRHDNTNERRPPRTLEEQQQACMDAHCKLLGALGCIMTSLELSPQVRVTLATPCSDAVARSPHRQQEAAA